MFDARNISLSAGTKELLNNASFRIGDKDRVGLVGLNGTGKSTLLRFITATGSGTEVISSGEITKSASTTIGYLPQEISFEDDLETTALHYALQANKNLMPYRNVSSGSSRSWKLRGRIMKAMPTTS